MPIRLYNTRTRKKQVFRRRRGCEPVTMYVCGPTVYSSPHIGNARPAVVFDVLYRLLKRRYPEVIYVRNITDVDDKINNAALQEDVDISVINARYTKIYHEDMRELGVLDPTKEPRVTNNIRHIIRMIRNLVDSKHAYEANGHVLFKVRSFNAYGKLSRRDRKEMIAGARVEVAPYKDDPADFILWKPSDESQPGWGSPWGRGRPGWHIECSAMAKAHLGETIDIHGGGVDLVFPHHENELAQSTCANGGATFARYWMHNGFVNVEHEKMSKSIGNVLLVSELLKQAPGEAIRLALLTTHYRQPLDWTEIELIKAKAKLDHWYRGLEKLRNVPEVWMQGRLPIEQATVEEDLEDDLNTWMAIARIDSLVDYALEPQKLSQFPTGNSISIELGKLKYRIRKSANLLGLLTSDPQTWFQGGVSKTGVAEIERLIAERTRARADKDFAAADRIREALAEKGVLIEDGPQGTVWKRGG